MPLSTGSVRSGMFRLLWAGQTVSVVGDGAAVLAVPLLMLQITGNPILAALAATPRTVAYLLVGLLSGPLADRWDSRRVLISCDIGRAALFAVMPLTVHAAGGAALLLVLACLAAGLGVLFETSMAKAVQSLLQVKELVAGNARLELSSQLGVLLGPALTGAFVSLIGIDHAIWLNAATFAASIGTLLPIRLSNSSGNQRTAASAPGNGRRSSLWQEMREGISYIRAHPLISRLVMVQAVVNFVIAAETLLVFYATIGLHTSAAWTGAILAAAGVGGVLAAAAASRLATRTSPGVLIGWSVIALGGTLLAFALAVHPAVLLAANLLHGGLSIFATIHIRALRQRLVPSDLLGRVTANARTIAFIANPLGAVLFGAIAYAAGGDARWSFAAAALFSVASGVLAYRGLVAGYTASSSSPAQAPEAPGEQTRHRQGD